MKPSTIHSSRAIVITDAGRAALDAPTDGVVMVGCADVVDDDVRPFDVIAYCRALDAAANAAAGAVERHLLR